MIMFFELVEEMIIGSPLGLPSIAELPSPPSGPLVSRLPALMPENIVDLIAR